jgi:hypothetical protein
MRIALRAAAALLLVAIAASCSKPEDPIQVEQTAINILNQTDHDWKGVLIVVNDHFRGQVPVLKSKGRLNAPMGQFETGYGQRWPASQRVTKVVVTATDANNQPVKLEWDVNTARQPRR